MLTLRNSPTMISPKCSFLKQTGVVITPRNFGNKDEKKSKIYPFHSDGYRGYPSPEVDEPPKDEYRKCSGVLIRDNLVLVSQDCLGPSKPYEISVVFLHEADMTTHFYLPEDQARIARYLNSYNRWYLNPPAMVMDENPNWQKIDDSQIQLQFTSNGAQRNVRLHQHTVSLYPLDSDCDPP